MAFLIRKAASTAPSTDATANPPAPDVAKESKSDEDSADTRGSVETTVAAAANGRNEITRITKEIKERNNSDIIFLPDKCSQWSRGRKLGMVCRKEKQNKRQFVDRLKRQGIVVCIGEMQIQKKIDELDGATFDDKYWPDEFTLYHLMDDLVYLSGEKYQHAKAVLEAETFRHLCMILGAQKISTVGANSTSNSVNVGGKVSTPTPLVPVKVETSVEKADAVSFMLEINKTYRPKYTPWFRNMVAEETLERLKERRSVFKTTELCETGRNRDEVKRKAAWKNYTPEILKEARANFDDTEFTLLYQLRCIAPRFELFYKRQRDQKKNSLQIFAKCRLMYALDDADFILEYSSQSSLNLVVSLLVAGIGGAAGVSVTRTKHIVKKYSVKFYPRLKLASEEGVQELIEELDTPVIPPPAPFYLAAAPSVHAPIAQK